MNRTKSNGTTNDAPCNSEIDKLRNEALDLIKSMTDGEILATLCLLKKSYQ